MTIFTAAAAAALEVPTNAMPTGIYSYNTEVQFDVIATGNKAPALLLRLLQKLVNDEPNIVFCDSDQAPINIDEFPTAKETFDVLFSTSTNRNKLSCRFEIRSARKSFHSVKIGVWAILQEFQIWFKKSPGPIKRIPLQTLGFWVNIHPGFASPRSVIEELKQDLLENYTNHPAIQKHALPAEFSPTDMYLARGRVSGQFHATTSTNSTATSIDADVMLMYSSADDFDRTLIFLTQISSLRSPLSDQAPMFIPFALKKSNPQKFGYYISQQNTFMKNHRNIAVVGVSSDLMDLEDSSGTSLWYAIRSLPGVYRCDPCARTPDLGKWNISSALSYNATLKKWLTENLPLYFNAAPATFPKIATFPCPEILSKDRRGSSSLSVNSGITDASPLDDYMRSLESNVVFANQPPMVARNPWISTTPVEDINYSFNMDDFQTLPNGKPTDTTRTTVAASSVAESGLDPATAVSAITEDVISNAVKTQMAGLEATRVAHDADFFERLRTIEDSIADITSTVDNISSMLANSVLALLTAPTGALTIQMAKLDTQNTTIVRFFAAITSLTADVKRLGHATETLTRSPPESPPNGSPAKKHCSDGAPAAALDTNPMRLE
jgi:hypothetical protein